MWFSGRSVQWCMCEREGERRERASGCAASDAAKTARFHLQVKWINTFVVYHKSNIEWVCCQCVSSRLLNWLWLWIEIATRFSHIVSFFFAQCKFQSVVFGSLSAREFQFLPKMHITYIFHVLFPLFTFVLFNQLWSLFFVLLFLSHSFRAMWFFRFHTRLLDTIQPDRCDGLHTWWCWKLFDRCQV